MNKGTKIGLIIAGALILAGILMFIGVMTFVNWDFVKLTNDQNYQTNIYEISEDFSKISIDVNTADLCFVPSDDNICRVECYEDPKEKHVVSAENGTLTVRVILNKNWHDYIGINLNTPKLTISLPKAKYDELTVLNDTGDMTFSKDFYFEDLNIKASTGDIICVGTDAKNVTFELSTGDITLGAMTAEEISLITSTGDIQVTSVACNDLSTTVSTGDVHLEDVSCKNLTSTGNSGDLKMKNVIAEGKINVTRTTGDVKLNHCDGGELFLQTSTGDIEGSLLTEKIFLTQTSTGDIHLPKTSSGGTCEIITSTGDMEIKIEQ